MEKQRNENVQLLNAHELARILALSVRQIFRLNASGQIPAPVKIGGSVRWSAIEIQNWIASNTPDRHAWERIKKTFE